VVGVCKRCDSKGDREQEGLQVCMLEGLKVRRGVAEGAGGLGKIAGLETGQYRRKKEG
jgi:hypothetical protein